MAVPAIIDVMNAIQAALANNITGLRVTEFRADQINPPQAIIGVPPIPAYHAAFAHGTFLIHPTITIITSKSYDRIGQTALAGYANPTGATSIHAAIELDKTLGGVVDNCIVESFTPGDQNIGGFPYYGGVFQLKVTAKGA